MTAEGPGVDVGAIWDLVQRAVDQRPDKTWLYFDDDSYTYRDLTSHSSARAGTLSADGVRLGQRVVLVLPNCPEFLFVWLGLMRLGAVVLAANPSAAQSELAGLLTHARPHLVITDHPHRATVESAVQAGAPQARLALVEDLRDAGDQGLTGTPQAPRSADVATLITTSGTTGRPKLVMQTHRSYVMAAEGFGWWLGLTEHDRLLTTLPLFHLNAQVYSTLGSLTAGASLALLPRFSASRFWAETRRYGATEFNAIGAMVEILMRQPEAADDADNPVRLCYSAPAPPRERHLEIERRFGLQLTIGYALSESPYGAIWPRAEPRPFGSMGKPRQHPRLGRVNEAKVVDAEGVEVATGQTGELLLRNPATMAGYFDDPEETANVLHDGWLHTGDLVRVDDDGWLYFVGRKKEVIRRRGENISPAEVEAVLAQHPGVAEAAVVGVPSELSEEDVKAFIEPDDGVQPDPAELRAWCQQRLAAFKVPRYVEFVAALPHTPTGRVVKTELPRERTTEEHDLVDG